MAGGVSKARNGRAALEQAALHCMYYRLVGITSRTSFLTTENADTCEDLLSSHC